MLDGECVRDNVSSVSQSKWRKVCFDGYERVPDTNDGIRRILVLPITGCKEGTLLVVLDCPVLLYVIS